MMTKTAVWCRHSGDNIIGVGRNIPWNVPSDIRKYRKIVSGFNQVMGRNTYESIPPAALVEETVFVLTSDAGYQVINPQKHLVITDIGYFKDFAEDLYICGGAKVYEAFMTSSPKLYPDIIVDCVYGGTLAEVTGDTAEITPCVERLAEKYIKVGEGLTQDNVANHLYIKRGDFVEQSVLKRILSVIEEKN